MYFYVKNLQGNIVNIADSNGNIQVRYDYDVFGKITAVKNGSNQAITDTSNLAFLNPLRYQELALVPIVNRMIPNSVYYNTLLEYQKIMGINGAKLTFRRYQ